MKAKIHGKFWREYQKIIKDQMIPYQWKALNDDVQGAEPSHVIANFEIAAHRREGNYVGMVFQDSDLYKWIEAASYSLLNFPDKDLEKKIDGAVDLIHEAQLQDGYLNTYYQVEEGIGNRWTNLRDNHELYCAGHLIEAAIAYYSATGKQKLLQVAVRFVNHIKDVFGEGKSHGYPGHEEIELALIKLYLITNNETDLELAKFFIDQRGTSPHYFDLECKKYDRGPQSWWDGDYEYSQSHQPVREQKEAAGHAVRAMYLYCAIADLARITKDQELKEVIEGLWNNVTQKKMSVNGGIGASSWGESFSAEYDLPNDTAYNETCASVGLVFWARRMLELTNQSQYADVLENALYNGCLCGMDVQGKHFFYVNPLEINHTGMHRRDHRHVKCERQGWFNCACCPPNLARLVQSIGDYVYHFQDNTLYVDLYAACEVEHLFNENKMLLVQTTSYPWEGYAGFKINSDREESFQIALRIPQWASDVSLEINGNEQDLSETGIIDGYLRLNRTWKDGDEFTICFSMEVKEIYANPRVTEDLGKVAVSRGPLIYAAEQIDNGDNLAALFLKSDEYKIFRNDSILHDTVFIQGKGIRVAGMGEPTLYSLKKPAEISQKVTLIPYFLWGNRGYGEMSVWIKK